jgi:HEAT repeat protein
LNERKELPLRPPPGRGSGSEGAQLESARNYVERLRGEPAEVAVPKLIEVLGDESWYLRERAADALVGFGTLAAPALEVAARSGLWYTRAASLRVLGRLGEGHGLTLVMRHLDDANNTIAEAAQRTLLDYCAGGRSLVVAKLLHARGEAFREKVLGQLSRREPDLTARLRRLVEATEFMGPEGALEKEEQARLVEEVSDAQFGVTWSRLGPSESLPAPGHHLVHYLRGEEKD